MNKTFTLLFILCTIFFIQEIKATDSLHVCSQTTTGLPIEQVNITAGSPLLTPITTNMAGCVSFEVSSGNGTFIIAPTKDINPANGVDVLDLFLISNNILAINLLDNPLKLIAADVNQSMAVTTFDLVIIQRLIMGVITEFPNSPSWRFVDQNFVFSNNPFDPIPNFPEFVQVTAPLNGNLTVGFTGIKMGDVSGNANPQQLTSPTVDTRSGELALHIEDRQVMAGETFTVDITAENFSQMIGYQFTTQFDATQLDFVEVIPGPLANLTTNNFNIAEVEDGLLPTAWFYHEAQDLADTAILFSITFTANETVSLKDVISIGSDPTPMVAYNVDLEEMEIVLEFEGDVVGVSTKQKEIATMIISPNPVQELATINYSLEKAGEVQLVITDVSGKIITTLINTRQSAGKYSLSFSPGDNIAPGIYFSRLLVNDEIIVKKLVLL